MNDLAKIKHQLCAIERDLARVIGAIARLQHGEDSANTDSASLHDYNLTLCEQKILELLAAGHANAEIARLLIIELSTVKFHCSNIYKKLGVKTRTQAIAKFSHREEKSPTIL